MLPVGINHLLPFITIPIFTRIFNPEDYGILALSMIYGIFMSGLANLGMTLAFERNFFLYKESSEKLAQLFYSSLVFVTINFSILAGLTYSFRVIISEFITGSPNHGGLIMTIFFAQFFSNIINNFFFIYLKNYEKAKINSKYKIINTIMNFVLSLFFVAFLKIGIIGIAFAQLISGVLIFIFFLYLFLQELPFSLNKSILLESLRISYPLFPRIFIGVINTQFDKYMISLLATVGGVGLYHIGKKISESVFNFITIIENVFNPQIYQRMFEQHEQGSESIGRYLTPFLYISIFVALCVGLFSEEIMTVLAPVSYHGAIPVITILVMYFGFLFFGKITSIQVLYSKKTHIISIMSFFSVGLNVCLNIPMIMKFGIIGAAGATSLSGIISSSLGIIIAQHLYKIHWEWKKIAWIMGTFLIGATVIAFMNLLDIPYFWSLIIKIIFLAFYLNLGIYYKIITKENYREIGSIFRPLKTVTT